MYAIIRAGGKQYTVKPGDVLRVEKLEGELGAELELTDVLFVGGDKNFVGAPTVSDAKVTVVVTNQQRGPKIVIFKKKRRQGYRRMGGHRQAYTELFIKAITSPEGQTAQAAADAKVYSFEKKAQRLAKKEETRQMKKEEKRQAQGDQGETVSKVARTTKKKTAKKTAAKKTAGKKKKVAKKKTAAKKKTTKKSSK